MKTFVEWMKVKSENFAKIKSERVPQWLSPFVIKNEIETYGDGEGSVFEFVAKIPKSTTYEKIVPEYISRQMLQADSSVGAIEWAKRTFGINEKEFNGPVSEMNWKYYFEELFNISNYHGGPGQSYGRGRVDIQDSGNHYLVEIYHRDGLDI
jgi:hypothetical protein